MKTSRVFVVAFCAVFLTLLGLASPTAIAIVVGCAFYAGGFAALIFVVAADLGSARKVFRPRTIVERLRSITAAQLITLGVLLSLIALTFAFGVFPYLWCAVAMVLLGAGVAWRCLSDYAELLGSRRSPVAPLSWQVLEEEQLPAVSEAHLAHAKSRLQHGLELHISCTPRAGALSLSSHPLRMDE